MNVCNHTQYQFNTIVSVIKVLKCLGGRVLEIYDPRELM